MTGIVVKNFFQWVYECCKLMGKDKDYGHNLLPAKDPSWYWCFDDGMTPEEAVAKYKLTHPEVK